MRQVLTMAVHELRLLRRSPKILVSHLIAILTVSFLFSVNAADEPQALAGQLAALLLAVWGGAPLTFGVHMLVSEKERRTLESLLLTPVRKVELLTSKTLVLILIAAADFVLVTLIVSSGRQPVVDVVLGSPVLMAVALIVGPLFACICGLVAVVVSGRSADAQTAASVAPIVVAPVLLLVAALWAGVAAIDARLTAATTVIFVIGIAILIRAGTAALDDDVLVARRGQLR